MLVTQTSFCEGSSGDLAKRRLLSQAICLEGAVSIIFSWKFFVGAFVRCLALSSGLGVFP